MSFIFNIKVWNIENKYITDENDMTKNLKESISVETDPETRKGLIENYMLLKGIKDTGDETCK